MATIYIYKNCDSCRKALRWLAERGIVAEQRHVRETPPSVPELEQALTGTGGDLRKLFNTSGADYREMDLKNRLPEMEVADALRLLATHGNLVKRPLFLGDGVALAGFNPAGWDARLC